MNKPVKFDMKLNSTQEIIDDIKAGKMVVIMDDEDRENEGDILMAAEAVTLITSISWPNTVAG